MFLLAISSTAILLLRASQYRVSVEAPRWGLSCGLLAFVLSELLIDCLFIILALEGVSEKIILRSSKGGLVPKPWLMSKFPSGRQELGRIHNLSHTTCLVACSLIGVGS